MLQSFEARSNEVYGSSNEKLDIIVDGDKDFIDECICIVDDAFRSGDFGTGKTAPVTRNIRTLIITALFAWALAWTLSPAVLTAAEKGPPLPYDGWQDADKDDPENDNMGMDNSTRETGDELSSPEEGKIMEGLPPEKVVPVYGANTR